MRNIFCFAVACLLCAACTKTANQTDKNIQFQFKFEPTQDRLDGFGRLQNTLPAGHAGQTPTFNSMAIHYIELAKDSLTPLGTGVILYRGTETTVGGANAIDFSKLAVKGANAPFLPLPLKGIAAGEYKWIRVSVAYQNLDIKYNLVNLNTAWGLGTTQLNQGGRVAALIGFNSYVTNLQIDQQSVAVNANKTQGFGAMETKFSGPLAQPPYSTYIPNRVITWQSPAGATTVVNPFPLPLPAGSCVVTGKFAKPLVITGAETADILTTLSFSINKSIEWIDTNGNGQLDFDVQNSANNEAVIDMGLRGLKPSWQ